MAPSIPVFGHRSRLRRPRVVVIAPGRIWGEFYLAGRCRESEDVVLVAGLDDVPEVTGTSGIAQLRLRRCDRVEWLAGWSHGPDGDAFARTLEAYAAAGGFGAARHRFEVAA